MVAIPNVCVKMAGWARLVTHADLIGNVQTKKMEPVVCQTNVTVIQAFSPMIQRNCVTVQF